MLYLYGNIRQLHSNIVVRLTAPRFSDTGLRKKAYDTKWLRNRHNSSYFNHRILLLHKV